MRIQHLAVFGFASVLVCGPALAQDAAAAIAQNHNDAMRGLQESLHSESVDYRFLSGAELAKRIAEYRRETDLHRLNALQIAEQARTSALPVGTGARIREALEADLTLWHDSLPVNARDWDSMRKQWLVPVGSLTDQQWAQQRANWFAARDAWLDKRAQTAELVRH